MGSSFEGRLMRGAPYWQVGLILRIGVKLVRQGARRCAGVREGRGVGSSGVWTAGLAGGFVFTEGVKGGGFGQKKAGLGGFRRAGRVDRDCWGWGRKSTEQVPVGFRRGLWCAMFLARGMVEDGIGFWDIGSLPLVELHSYYNGLGGRNIAEIF
jgi:hypothetical protein